MDARPKNYIENKKCTDDWKFSNNLTGQFFLHQEEFECVFKKSGG